jgi:transposase-like protein
MPAIPLHLKQVDKAMPSKYDPEKRAKAFRLVLDRRDDYLSEWAAIAAVSKKLGINAETLGIAGQSRVRTSSP